jgi:hypothetical protein
MSPFVGCCHPPAAWGIEAIPRLKEGSEGLLVVDHLVMNLNVVHAKAIEPVVTRKIPTILITGE